MFRTSYSFVALSRAAVPDQLALMWYGNYNPASSSYAPFYVASDHLPPSYTRYIVIPVFILFVQSRYLFCMVFLKWLVKRFFFAVLKYYLRVQNRDFKSSVIFSRSTSIFF